MAKSSNVTWHSGSVTESDRAKIMGCKGCLLWFTGLSGSGKSTVARALEAHLVENGYPAYVLDGDNIRHGLNGDLGFSPNDRKENIRRITEVGTLFVDAGMITITAFISPYQSDRDAARNHLKEGQFFEVHIATSLAACEARDPKGLYKKVREGEIKQFTGVDAPYETPVNPELRIDTEHKSLEQSVAELVQMLSSKGILHRS